jgi:cephalosporin hydroxylase
MNSGSILQGPRETGRFSFCPALAEVMGTRRLKGRSGKVFEKLGALSSVNNLAVLRNLCLELKPRHTLEIGLCFGGSCLVFTASHRDLGRAPERQHVAVDPHQTTVWDDSGLLLVEKAGLSPFLDFRPQFSSLELPNLIQQGRKSDLVYIDGSHLFEDVFVDFYFVGQLLAEGGLMAFDDSSDPHVSKVLRFIRGNFSGSHRELDLAPFRADQGRNLKYQIARLLRKNQLTAFRKVGPSVREWNSPFAEF